MYRFLLFAFCVFYNCNAYALGTDFAIELERALKINPEIEAKFHELQMYKATEAQAKNGYLPKVEATSKFGLDHNGDDTNLSKVRNAKKFELSVRQNLYNGMETKERIEVAQYKLNRVQVEYNNLLQGVTSDAVIAYLEYLKSKEVLEIAVLHKNMANRIIGLAQKRVDAGVFEKEEVIKAQIFYQISFESHLDAKNKFKNAEATYKKIFGMLPIGDLGMISISSGSLPNTIDEAITIADVNNLKIYAAVLESNVKKHQIQVTKAASLPTLDLVGKSSYQNDFDGIDGNSVDYSVMLEAKLVLFDGYEVKEKIGSARSEYKKSLSEVDFTKAKVYENVETSFYNNLTEEGRYEILRAASISTNELRDAKKKKRDSGVSGVTDISVLELELKALEITKRLLDSKYTSQISIVMFASALGIPIMDLVSLSNME